MRWLNNFNEIAKKPENNNNVKITFKDIPAANTIKQMQNIAQTINNNGRFISVYLLVYLTI